jgi:hypothetical protein
MRTTIKYPLPACRLAAVLAGIAAAVLPFAATSDASDTAHARASRTLNVTDEAHLHVTGTEGAYLTEEGAASGALRGTVKVDLNIGVTVNGSFTIYVRGGGSISGHGSARLRSTGTYASFAGSMSVSHGTGRYAHAHGHGGFYGTVDRRTDALVIQTTGTLSY